ncbi:MAG: hypothetical protein JO023_14985 [Chloroflexi bacterium]|nr:hypothetical protein [Chloroflexota bacterium]
MPPSVLVRAEASPPTVTTRPEASALALPESLEAVELPWMEASPPWVMPVVRLATGPVAVASPLTANVLAEESALTRAELPCHTSPLSCVGSWD